MALKEYLLFQSTLWCTISKPRMAEWAEKLTLKVRQPVVLDHMHVQEPDFSNLHLPGLTRHKVLERSSGTTLGLVFLFPRQGKVITSDLVLEEVEDGLGEVLEDCTRTQPLAIRRRKNAIILDSTKADLMEAGRHGWVRVVVVNGQEISYVYYLPPKDQEARGVSGGSGMFKSVSRVEAHLVKVGNPGGLDRKNFNIHRKLMGLGEPFEITRKSKGGAPGSVRPPLDSAAYFLQYFTDSDDVDPDRYHIDGTLKKDRSVVCNLCSIRRLMSFKAISKHMKSQHLPDEDCPNCGQDFPASRIKAHMKTCLGDQTASRSDGDQTASQSLGDQTTSCPSLGDQTASSEILGEATASTAGLEFGLAPAKYSDVGTILNSIKQEPSLDCVKKDSQEQRVMVVPEIKECIKEEHVSPEKKMVSLTMVVSGKEIKLLVNADKHFRKAMKTISLKLKKDISSLVFRIMDSEVPLTGKENMGQLEGAKIVVEM